MSTLDFRITSSRVGSSAHVVCLAGELDVHTAPQLEEEFRALLLDGATRIVVDLAGASFIDSTTLGVLVRALGRLRAEGGELVLVSDDARILRAFQVTGLDRYFTIERTLTEGVDRLVARVASS